RIVGMLRTLKRMAVLGLASTSSFVTLSLPLYSAASWSRMGATMRQGPHQVAQKSTTASPSCFSISCAKSLSVTAMALDIVLTSTVSGMRRDVVCVYITLRSRPLTEHPHDFPRSFRRTRCAHWHRCARPERDTALLP